MREKFKSLVVILLSLNCKRMCAPDRQRGGTSDEGHQRLVRLLGETAVMEILYRIGNIAALPSVNRLLVVGVLSRR